MKKIKPSMLQRDLIGLYAEVTRSPHPSYVGIAGRGIDETRNILVISHKNKKKTIVKDVAVFNFTMPNGTIMEVDGKAIIGRPENRIKRWGRRRW